MVKNRFVIVDAVDTHVRRHDEGPVEEHCFFEGTSQAGFLVTQSLTGFTVLPWAVYSVAPIQVTNEPSF